MIESRVLFAWILANLIAKFQFYTLACVARDFARESDLKRFVSATGPVTGEARPFRGPLNLLLKSTCAQSSYS